MATGARRRIVRPLAIVLGGIVLMWLSIAITLAMAASASSPAAVLSLWPSAAMAKAAAASTLINDAATLQERNKAFNMAGAALLREPVLADAASMLGLSFNLQGQHARANVAFEIAERLSRRELRAQMWFIERMVQRGDVNGALRHYDIVLRVTPSSSSLLLPVLAGASDKLMIRRPLMARLRNKPAWQLDYLRVMLKTPPNPAAVADQIAHSGLDPAIDADRKIISEGLTYLVQVREYRLAAAALSRIAAGPASTIRNAGFETAPALLPFDWWFNTDTDLSAYREPGRLGNGSYILRVSSDNRGGQVARQLVVLSPGQYTLEGIGGTSGDTGGTMPMFTVTCADTRTTLVTKITKATSRGLFAVGFAVPLAGCAAQWIGIETPLGASISAWVDALQLRSTATR